MPVRGRESTLQVPVDWVSKLIGKPWDAAAPLVGSHEPLVVSTRRYFCLHWIYRRSSGQSGTLPTVWFASRRVGEMAPNSHSCAVDFTNDGRTLPRCVECRTRLLPLEEDKRGYSDGGLMRLTARRAQRPNAVCL